MTSPPPQYGEKSAAPDRRRGASASDGGPALDRHDAEKARFGGMRFGTAFFGWLTATGASAVLAAIVSAVGVGIGVGSDAGAGIVSGEDARAIGVGGGIALVVIAFLGYLAGGYVAGRMARFSGVKQGLAVWLWAVIVAVVLGIAGLIAGARFKVLGNLGGVPRIPDADGLTAASIIAAVSVVVVALVGALLGGLLGMRYHRRVDREGDAAER